MPSRLLLVLLAAWQPWTAHAQGTQCASSADCAERAGLAGESHPEPLDTVLARCDASMTTATGNPEGGIFPDLSDCLTTLARMGEAASSAVPWLSERLPALPPAAASAVIDTLGHIGNAQAVPTVLAYLQASDDRLALAATGALWRLRADAAIDALRTTERTHWYRPVREFAGTVRRAMETHDLSVFPEAWLRDTYRRVSVGGYANGWQAWPRTYEPNDQRCLRWQHLGMAFARGDADTPPPADASAHAQFSAITTTLHIDGGRLHGIDHGEFGGGLHYQSGEAPPIRLTQQNVQALLRLNDTQTLALVGLAHMLDPGGEVLVIDTTLPQTPRIDRRVRLPSVPDLVFPVPEGWLIVMASGETVLLGKDLTLHEAGECIERMQSDVAA